MSPSQQGSVTGVTWNRLRIDATKLAQRQTIGHKMLDLFVAPAAQAPHHQTLGAAS
jgi:hypothetical protein